MVLVIELQLKEIFLNYNLGFSHPINYEFPKGLQISVEKNIITIKGDDKQVVGQVAAEVRSFRPPEPYKARVLSMLKNISAVKREKLLRNRGSK